MENLKELIPLVLPHVRGCDNNIIKMELGNAVRRFCREAWVLRERHELSVVAGTDTYDLTVESDAIIQQVQRVTLDNRDLNPRAYTILVPEKQIILHYAPTKDGVLKYEVILVPSFTAQELNKDILERYAEAFVAGALAKLYMMPQKPWTNFDLAQMHEYEYQDFRRTAKVDTAFGGKCKELRVKMINL